MTRQLERCGGPARQRPAGRPCWSSWPCAIAEPNRGGGLVEGDRGARKLAHAGGIEREDGCPPLIVALLKERDLALLQLSDLRSVRIELEEDFQRSRRLGVGLPASR